MYKAQIYIYDTYTNTQSICDIKISWEELIRKPISSKILKESIVRDFPGGPVVKNPLSNAGDVGSIPGQGTKVPQAVRQQSPCTTTETPCSQINKNQANKINFKESTVRNKLRNIELETVTDKLFFYNRNMNSKSSDTVLPTSPTMSSQERHIEIQHGRRRLVTSWDFGHSS